VTPPLPARLLAAVFVDFLRAAITGEPQALPVPPVDEWDRPYPYRQPVPIGRVQHVPAGAMMHPHPPQQPSPLQPSPLQAQQHAEQAQQQRGDAALPHRLSTSTRAGDPVPAAAALAPPVHAAGLPAQKSQSGRSEVLAA
jgi:hypothetical protein